MVQRGEGLRWKVTKSAGPQDADLLHIGGLTTASGVYRTRTVTAKGKKTKKADDVIE
jgi:hypothetical protein